MGTHGIGVFGINSKFTSGNLVFYEKAVGRTATGDVLTIGTTAVTVGNTANDIDFKVFGAISGNYMLYDSSENRLDVTSIGAYVRPALTVTRTFVTADFASTYHAVSRVTLSLTNDVPNAKYASALNVRVTGAADVASGGTLYGLWVDSDGTAAAIGGTFYMARFSVQANAARPTAYLQFGTADPGVTYAFSFSNNIAVPPCIADTGTPGANAIYKIAVDCNGTPGYLAVYADF